MRQDSDGSGSLSSGDSGAESATVRAMLTHDTNGSGTYTCGAGDDCWEFNAQTDASGNVAFKLLRAPNGRYLLQVTALSHPSYTWNTSLDRDNPDTFTK